MQAFTLMTENPACYTPWDSLHDVAHLMVIHHCGAIPVVDNRETMTPIGIITDRDIICRCLATGLNPFQMAARNCMSSPVVTVPPETALAECCLLMEQNQIRRLPVVNNKGKCIGIVSQADIAKRTSNHTTAAVVKAISIPTMAASQVAKQ